MRIGIVGAGAIGCLFGGLLGRAGHDIALVHRDPEVVRLIREKGVRIREPNGRILHGLVSARLAPADLTDRELVIFTVKSYDTDKAAESHRRHVGNASKVLTLQNGLGNIETLSRYFGKIRVLGGITTEASLLLGPGFTAHTGHGKTVIGRASNGPIADCIRIARAITRAGIPTSVTEDVSGRVWAKVLINSAVNPVSALLRLPNGALLKAPGLLSAMFDVVSEGLAVAKAEGIELGSGEMQRLLRKVLSATAFNRSSMLQDLERLNRTEIRQLNGAIVTLGNMHSVPTPLNRFLLSAIEVLEKRSKFRGGGLPSNAFRKRRQRP